LKLICEGFCNTDIAEKLFISHRTVDRHRSNLLSKTGCRNSTSLVMYAVKNKIIEV
jgi:DNA-binding NarL/FixJ family response regulator